MSITTIIIIIIVCLLIYYCAQIGYDLYMDNLSQINKDDDNEKAIDISGQAEEFMSIPVNNPKTEESVLKKFQDTLMMGISASKINRLAISAAEGSPSRELEGMLYAIQNYPEE